MLCWSVGNAGEFDSDFEWPRSARICESFMDWTIERFCVVPIVCALNKEDCSAVSCKESEAKVRFEPLNECVPANEPDCL